MIEGLKPYPAYKASGLPWADLIPQHWGLLPNRALVRKRKVLVGEQHHSYRLLSLTKQGVIVRDVASGKGKFSSDMGTSQEVRIGDLVFCLFDVPETPRTVGLSAHAGMITGAYTVFESIVQKTAGYFEVFYRAMDDRKLLSPLYSGLRNTIPPDRLLGTKTPQPPADEQAAIVRFLDHANRRIDRFIRAKRKLIALLNEQKQAIIHRAVTRGLAPNVPMKDSGVPWLGEIPAHWQVKKIKHLVTTIGGMTPNKSTARFWSGEIPWVSPKDMKRKLIEDSRDHISALAIRATGIALIPPPAVLIVVRGMILARTFPTAVTGMATTINQDMKALLPGDEVDAGYLSFLLTGLERDLLALVEEAGHGTRCLRTDAWSNTSLPIPPRSEQAKILCLVDERTGGIEATLGQVEREIFLIHEYRTRLVADVVTGQLDVREAAARLPADEPEAAGEELASEADQEEDSEPEEMAE